VYKYAGFVASFFKNTSAVVYLCVAGNPPGSVRWIIQSGSASAVQRTGSTLTLDSVQLRDSGNYSCIASNLHGTESSDASRLLVNGNHLRWKTAINRLHKTPLQFFLPLFRWSNFIERKKRSFISNSDLWRCICDDSCYTLELWHFRFAM